MVIAGACALGWLSGGCAGTHPRAAIGKAPAPAVTYELRLGAERTRFDPGADADLSRLEQKVADALGELKKQGKSTNAALAAAAKKYKRGLQEIERLARGARKAALPEERKHETGLLLEVVCGVNNDQEQPVPERIDVVELPGLLWETWHHPVGRGKTAATDLAAGVSNDLSKLDPKASTFWQKPANIAAEDLYDGFGRTNMNGIEGKMSEYEGPKDSYGTNPGFEVGCDGVKVKLKFAELSSEPLTTRMYDALGFHADVTDYSPGVRVRYDRRILTEFNSRRELKTRFTLVGVTYYTMRLQKKYDPFRYIARAVMRDGREWTGMELKTNLFKDAARKHPESDAANYRAEVETNIDYVVTVAANVQPKAPDIKTIGSWKMGELDHAGRRELRGVGVLAAWLGFFDTRYDNMRVRLVKNGGDEDVVHYFSDLGGGLGQTTGFAFMHGERPNEFPWSFTKPGRTGRPLRIAGYKPIVRTEAFTEMTIDDARWMARLIGQLSEQQIVEALAGAGYDSAEVRLYTEKLVSRRDEMIKDFGLSGQIGLLRPNGIDRRFSYDPKADGVVSVRLPDGREERAPAGNTKVVRGKLMAEKAVVSSAGARAGRQ